MYTHILGRSIYLANKTNANTSNHVKDRKKWRMLPIKQRISKRKKPKKVSLAFKAIYLFTILLNLRFFTGTIIMVGAGGKVRVSHPQHVLYSRRLVLLLRLKCFPVSATYWGSSFRFRYGNNKLKYI